MNPRPALLVRRLTCTAFVSLTLLTSTHAQTTIRTDTPARQVFAAWLDAFNNVSVNPDLLNRYIETYEPGLSLPEQVQRSETTGGLELRSIERDEPLQIEFVVTDRRTSESTFLGKLEVQEHEGQPLVAWRYFRPIPKDSPILGFGIDASTRSAVIGTVTARLTEFYLSRELADEMADDLQRRQRRGDYDLVTDGSKFADLLTQHLQETSKDTHLLVRFSPVAIPDRPSETNWDLARRALEPINCGFRKVEVLPGNIGYLKVDMFEHPDVCAATAVTAMNFVQNVETLIIDMRDSTGGWPSMVAFVATYLFDSPVHIGDTWTPSTNTTEQFWTSSYVPGKRLAHAPVYLLTSSRTHSGSEVFVDGLKTLGRATLVGETTRGGANASASYRISDQFSISVPFSQSVNPVTHASWQGIGIEPHIPVAAEDALSTALEVIAGQ